MAIIETDYLIVGAGAAGMSFADMLLTHTNADLTLIDRRFAPGGHWIDAYPFARLHMPSSCYGVDSTELGGAGLDPENDDALYERASAAEICAYYDHVLHQRFLPSGRVRFLPATDYLGGGSAMSRLTGDTTTVRYRKLVDATYLEGAIPATTPPPFDVAAEARCVPIGDLAMMQETAQAFVVIGAGKTGQDACLWLLSNGVPQEQVTWIRPRDPWLQTRLSAQPGPGLEATVDIYSHGMEAAAVSGSVEELFLELETAGVLSRIDPEVTPTSYAGAIISEQQLQQLRTVKNVVRMGRVRRIEANRIILDEGEIETSPTTLHVHCATEGLGSPALLPVFEDGLITVQNLRYGLLPLSAAIIGFIEATREGDESKNALCKPFRYTGVAEDWIRQRLVDLENGTRWRGAPDLMQWLDRTRLSMNAGMIARRAEPAFAASLGRIRKHAAAAEANLRSLAVDA